MSTIKSRTIWLNLSVLFLMLCYQKSTAQQTQTIEYKNEDSTVLTMDIHYPEPMIEGKRYPVMVFFFGGGWVTGRIAAFKHHAQYFSKKGIIGVLVDYRVRSRHQTTPFDALKDAKSAIRFLRSNAEKFKIDPEKVIASGGSAGGHLAAATALIDEYNDSDDDLSISPKPNALVLFNPVIDNGPGGYGFERIGDQYPDFSPLHNIHDGAPPTIIFLGTEDHLIPVETAKYYKIVMEKVGSRCDLILYPGQPHGFFHFGRQKYFNKTITETEQFLTSLGFIKKQ